MNSLVFDVYEASSLGDVVTQVSKNTLACAQRLLHFDLDVIRSIIMLVTRFDHRLESDTTVSDVLLIVGREVITTIVTYSCGSSLLQGLLFIYLRLALLKLVTRHGLGCGRFGLFMLQDAVLRI